MQALTPALPAGDRVVKTYGEHFASLGARDIRAIDDKVTMAFRGPRIAAWADEILQDNVAGADLVLRPHHRESNASAATLARMSARLPGVRSAQFDVKGDGNVVITAETKGDATRLAALLEPTFDGHKVVFETVKPTTES